MSSKPQKEFRDLVQRRAVEFGDFTLKSGAKSNFYIDMRKVVLSRYGARVIPALVYATVSKVAFNWIAGPGFGAAPIVGAMLSRSPDWARVAGGLLIRETKKAHGLCRSIEGLPKELDGANKVLMVEDVTTSGGSVISAIEALTAAGFETVHVVTLLDRLVGAGKSIRGHDANFTAILTIDDLDLTGLTEETDG